MKRDGTRILAAMLAAIFLTAAAGCTQETEPAAGAGDINTEDGGSYSSDLSIGETVNVSYSDFDTLSDWDETACRITLNGDSAAASGSGVSMESGTFYTVKITQGGTYVISGALENGQIYVEAGEEKVHLVLNGVSVNCSRSAAFYINNGRKTVITLAEGTVNTLTDAAEPEEVTEEPNAALFSKKALTINGSGTLQVTGNYNNGITCKDELRILGGALTVSAVNHGIRGNDAVIIRDGVLSVTAQNGDGLKASEEGSSEKGYIYIEGGALTLSAGDDGMQAATWLAIEGGTVVVAAEDDGLRAENIISVRDGALEIRRSYEGIEACVIEITGGTVRLQAEDDGLNASSGSSASDPRGGMRYDASCQIEISGGSLYVSADGDGIDSNGNLTVSGGAVTVDGPADDGNSALDADGTILVTGGVLIAAGSSGMAEYPDTASTQNVIIATFSQTQPAGSTVRITDADGNELLSFAPAERYASVIFSAPEIQSGEEYTVFSDETALGSVTVTETLSYIGRSGGMGGRPGGDFGGRPRW